MSGSPKHHAYEVRAPQPSLSSPNDLTYTERAPSGAVRAAEKKRVAIFVAHGMGQQIPFQTLDQIAEGLRREDARQNAEKPESQPKPVAETVAVGDQVLQRVVLELQRKGESHEVHVYEGYWAPLTEGKVTLRDVISFLFRAGFNGIKNGTQPFKRWLFDEYATFQAPIRTVLYLLIALAIVASLAVLNTAIVLVSAARSPLTAPPRWLSDGLFADLTTTFNAYLLSLIPFAIVLLGGILLRGKEGWEPLRRGFGFASIPLFFLVALATILAGLSLPLLFYGHIEWAGDTREELGHLAGDKDEIWPHLLGRSVEGFNHGFERCALVLLALFGAYFLLAWGVRIVRAVWRELFPREVREPARGRWLTLVYGVGFGLVVGIAVFEILQFLCWLLKLPPSQHRAVGTLVHGVSWPLLLVLGVFVRGILVQYVGDVALYATSHTLDRFDEVRHKIKDCVGKAARAVYTRKEPDGCTYKHVIAVGHSLGSVIVYDTLNRLILEDNLAGPADGFLDVAERTPLFLTFGSPLNKFAFLFALEAAKTTEAREALAAAAQPLLLENYHFRPKRWINLYSWWDIIGGPLHFYDLPGVRPGEQPKAVCNQKDPGATTFLAAHVEYWEGTLLFKTLYEQAIGVES
jgi:hypothetical protein